MPAAGVPRNVAVPFPVSWKVIPFGRVPLSVRLDQGNPPVSTVNEPACPIVNVTLFALVIEGASFTVTLRV